MVADSSSSYLTEDKLQNFFKFDSPQNFNALHVNCRSLNKNFAALKNLLSSVSGKLSIIAVSETWLTELSQDTFNLIGFNFVSNCRKNKIGGGVGLYIDDDIDFKIRTDASVMSDLIECIFIEIQQMNSSSILVGCVYRPPNTDISLFNLELLAILNKLSDKKSKPTIIAGDFNLDLLKSDVHAPTGEFLNCLTSHSFMPTIFYPTRIASTSATLIDNIFFNSIAHSYETAIIYNDISDHFPIAIHINLKLLKKVPTLEYKKRQFTADKIELFKRELVTVDWSHVYDDIALTADPNSCYSLFSDTFARIFENNFPLKSFKAPKANSPRNCWITKGLIKSCKRKSILYKKF